MSILFPYFELAASLFILLLCFQIFTRHYENRVARFFAMFALVAFLAAILEYSLRIAFTLELARDLNRIATSLWAFVFAMFAHFGLIFAKKNRLLENPWTLVFLYLPPGLLSLLFCLTNLMYTRYEIWPIGIVSQPAPLYWLFTLHTVFYSFLGIYLLFSFGRQSAQPIVKTQAFFIATGSLLPLLIGVLTDEVLPLVMGVRPIFPTAVFDITVMNFFIYLAMRRYSLFAVSPSIAADVIIETMPDALLATDFEGNILFANEEAAKLFCVDHCELESRDFASLFKNPKKYEQLYNEVVYKKKEILRFEAELIDPHGERVPSLINANLLRDKVVGDTIGIIFVIRDIRG
ncbi:MAG: PAS domain-containing protein [Candidatus Saganbacteria bacterium]|nr:PAS domain-containing protein [Candidatus Saganbacteria bacterium]